MEAIHEIAQRYGGDPRPWTDGPRAGEWEVLTTAKEISIALPPNPLGNTPIYELWSAGGCSRRCDGETCEMPSQTDQGAEVIHAPCLCTAKGEMLCKPKTRLTVILRGIRFGGGWRLETGGWNAAQEMPGMVEMIQSLQQRGVTRGLLSLAERKSVVQQQGKPTTVKFVVPALALDEDIEELAAGASRLAALAPANVAELAAAPPHEPMVMTDDPMYDDVIDGEIIDVEVVDESSGGGGSNFLQETPPQADRIESGTPDRTPKKKDDRQTALVLRVKDLADKHGLDHTELRHAFARTVSKGATENTSKLDADAKSRIMDALDDIESGDLIFEGILDGTVKARRL